MEYIINVFYGWVLLRLSKTWLLVLFIISAIWLIAIARYRGWIITGWDAPTFFDGFARVAFSFIAGLTGFRFRLIIRHKLHFLLPAVLLLGVFLFPHFEKDWLTEMFMVIIFFPFILALGAGTQVNGITRTFCVFTGRLSYPLYMTHIWAVWMFGNYLAKMKPGPAEMYLAAAGVFIGSCLMGYVALRLYDEPVRAKMASFK